MYLATTSKNLLCIQCIDVYCLNIFDITWHHMAYGVSNKMHPGPLPGLRTTLCTVPCSKANHAKESAAKPGHRATKKWTHNQGLHPRKLTWLAGNFLSFDRKNIDSNWWIFHCHVSCRGTSYFVFCAHPKNKSIWCVKVLWHKVGIKTIDVGENTCIL